MERIVYKPKFYCTIGAGILLGLTFPFAFMILDVKQLGLTFNFNNMFEIFKSQNIYIFSSVLFPGLFGAIAGLFFYISSQSRKMISQGHYIKNILDSINDAICVCDSNGSIEYANKRYINLYGSGQNSILKLLDIKSLNQLPQGQSYELDLENAKGRKSFISYTIHNLLESKETYNKDQYIVSIRDIEKLKQNENLILSQRDQLFEASKLSSLGEMAAGFAHEINNPLTIIQGRLKIAQRILLIDEIKNEAVLNNIETCLKTVARISKIIMSLKNLTHRTESQHDNDEVTILSLIEDPITVANMKLSGRNITFTVDAKEAAEATIVCNSIQISQVLINFLANSIDAIEEENNSWLKLSVEVNSTDAIFTITDSGRGIPLDIQKKMFEPMFTTKAIGKGTGLGLSISRSIIDKHNGSIKLDRNVSNTCFVIKIPRKKHYQAIAA